MKWCQGFLTKRGTSSIRQGDWSNFTSGCLSTVHVKEARSYKNILTIFTSKQLFVFFMSSTYNDLSWAETWNVWYNKCYSLEGVQNDVAYHKLDQNVEALEIEKSSCSIQLGRKYAR